MEYLFMDNFELAKENLLNALKKINLRYIMWSIVLSFGSKFRCNRIPKQVY
jgi:hypothetical protein